MIISVVEIPRCLYKCGEPSDDNILAILQNLHTAYTKVITELRQRVWNIRTIQWKSFWPVPIQSLLANIRLKLQAVTGLLKQNSPTKIVDCCVEIH